MAQDYRGTLAAACASYSRRSGAASLVLYDVTTLHFEAEHEDALRKVGMSKERRVDPQIQVGLLVDPSGFPLEVSCFEGNTAETTTLLPVLRGFAERHQVSDMVVVADAGMLSAANLNALEDAKFSFIVGSRISKAPYDLAAHFERHGNAFDDGQFLESTRVMGTGKAARSRRVVYHYLFARHKRDDRAINAMVDRAEKVAAGKRPLKKDRFVRIAVPDRPHRQLPHRLTRDVLTAKERARISQAERATQQRRWHGDQPLLPVGPSDRRSTVAPHHGVSSRRSL